MMNLLGFSESVIVRELRTQATASWLLTVSHKPSEARIRKDARFVVVVGVENGGMVGVLEEE